MGGATDTPLAESQRVDGAGGDGHGRLTRVSGGLFDGASARWPNGRVGDTGFAGLGPMVEGGTGGAYLRTSTISGR